MHNHLRDQFLLRNDVAFLNHGSFGACPRPVFETYQRWQRELEAQPVEFLGRRIDGLLAEARAALGGFLNAPPDDLVFVPNATLGINIVASALSLGPGDEVLAGDHEYGAADRTWRFLSERRGFRYVNQPIAVPFESEAAIIEQLWAGVNERTRVIFLSHITSPTALIFPIAEICRRAREAGILTVIDGAHAPGQIELDMQAIAADFYTGNLHKWLCAPKGSAFLYARPERQTLLAPLIVSWGWESRTPSGSPFQDYFGWTGTHDPAAFLSVPAAIAFQREHDWPQVRAACHALAVEARNQIAPFTSMQQICVGDEWWAQMFATPLPLCDAALVKSRMYDEFLVEAPLGEWNGHVLLRVSVQAYNTSADIERLMEALRVIFPRG